MGKSIYLEDFMTRKILEIPSGQSMIIGRGEDCDLSTLVDIDWISKVQAEIIYKNHGNIILIPRSENCDTYFQDVKLANINLGIEIYTGSEIKFGDDYRIRVLADNDPRIAELRKARSEDTQVMRSLR